MDLRRCRSGFAGAALDVSNVRRDLHSALGRMLNVAGYFLCRCTLLFHRRGNGRGYLRHPADGIADLLDGARRILRGGLDTADLLTVLTGRFRGQLGDRLLTYLLDSN